MADKPIIFSAAMVRALLEGRKSQTRRVLKPQPELYHEGRWHVYGRGGGCAGLHTDDVAEVALDYIPYAKGDLLWVREAWRTAAAVDDAPPRDLVPGLRPLSYEADYDREPNDGCRGRLRPSIHMPRWASRISLKVTGVRVQRLQEISEEDALAEGVDPLDSQLVSWHAEWSCDGKRIIETETRTRVPAFQRLWETLHGPGSWDANPWCCAISFERVQ